MSEETVKCEKCGEVVSENVEAYSKKNFDGHVYCYKCQKKVRGDGDTGSWTYDRPNDNAEEEKKGASEGVGDGAKPNDDEKLEEYDDKVTTELKAKSKELDKKIIELVTEMSRSDTEGFYAWLKTVYGVDDLETLNTEQKQAVLNETEIMAKGKETGKVTEPVNGNKTVEIDEGLFSFQERGEGELSCSDADGNVYVLNISVPDCSCSRFQENPSKRCPHLKAAAVGGFLESVEEKGEAQRKVATAQKQIEIDWDKIPKQVFAPKLLKALEYMSEDKTGFFAVIKANFDGKEHRTTLDSCDCGDFIHRGTSLNPCVHQIRIKYTDDEIRAKLKEFGAEDLLMITMKRKAQKDIAVSVPSTDSGMMIQGMMPRLAEVGKIKIGGKGEKMVRGHLLPQKWNHFAIATLMKDEDGRLVMDGNMNEIIGKDCKALDIYLCYDDPTMNMPTFYSFFTQSKLVCIGNGRIATRTQVDGSKVEKKCNPKDCADYIEKKCKPYGRLSVILASANRIGGTYVFRTTSWNTIRNVLSSMQFIRTVTGGALAGIKLRMTLLPMTVVPSSVGRNVKIYVVNIEFPGDMDALKDAAAEEIQRRIQLGMNMKQIEATDRELLKSRVVEEAEEEAVEIAEEFAPEEEG